MSSIDRDRQYIDEAYTAGKTVTFDHTSSGRGWWDEVTLWHNDTKVYGPARKGSGGSTAGTEEFDLGEYGKVTLRRERNVGIDYHHYADFTTKDSTPDGDYTLRYEIASNSNGSWGREEDNINCPITINKKSLSFSYTNYDYWVSAPSGTPYSHHDYTLPTAGKNSLTQDTTDSSGFLKARTVTTYTQSYWAYDGTTSSPGTTVNRSGNTTFTAGFSAQSTTTYFIRVRYYDGDVIYSDLTYESSGSSSSFQVTLPSAEDAATSARVGYTFVGWKIDDQTYDPEEEITLENGSHTISAVWSVNSYPVTIILTSAQSILSVPSGWNQSAPRSYQKYFDYGTPWTTISQEWAGRLSKTGYTLNETTAWTHEFETVGTTANELAPTWTINQYTLTWQIEGEEEPYYTITADYNSEITPPETPTKVGYTFSGWSSQVPARMPAEDKVFTGSFTINQYTVSLVANGGTFSDSSTTLKITQDYDTLVTAQTPTREGYVFHYWDPSVPDRMPAQNVTCVAQWGQLHSIVLDANGGLFPNGKAVYIITREAGEEFTYPTPSWVGHTFNGWGGTIPETMPENGASFYAQWTTDRYKFQIDYGDGRPSTVDYPYYGATLNVSAPEREGYTFTGWQKDGVAYTIPATMPAEEIVIQATWRINQYYITLDYADPDIPSRKITQDYGTEISVTDPTREHYRFIGWSPALPATMPANNNGVYVAQWEGIRYRVVYQIDEGFECSINSTLYTHADSPVTIYVNSGIKAPIPKLEYSAPRSSDTPDAEGEYRAPNYTRTHKEWDYELSWRKSGTAEEVTELFPTDNNTVLYTQATKINEVTTVYYGWVITYDLDGLGTNSTVKISKTTDSHTVEYTPTAPAASSQFSFLCWEKGGQDLASNPTLAHGAHTLKAIWVAYANLVVDTYAAGSTALGTWMEEEDSDIQRVTPSGETPYYRTKAKLRKGTTHTFTLPALSATTYNLVTRSNYYFTGFDKTSVTVNAGATDSSAKTTWGQYSIVCKEVGGNAYVQYNNVGADLSYRIAYVPTKANYKFIGWDESASYTCYRAASAPEPGSRGNISSVHPSATVTVPAYAPGYGGNSYSSNTIITYAVWYQYYHRLSYVRKSGEAWTWGSSSSASSTVWDDVSGDTAVAHNSTIPQRTGWWFRKYVVTNASASTDGALAAYRTYNLVGQGQVSVSTYYWITEHEDGAPEATAVSSISDIYCNVAGDSTVYLKPVGVQFKYTLKYYWEWGSQQVYGNVIEYAVGDPGWTVPDTLAAGPNPTEGTTEASYLDQSTVWLDGHPIFKGWAPKGTTFPSLSSTLYHPGETAPVVTTVPCYGSETPTPVELYARYLREGDLNVWRAVYHLTPETHCWATLNARPGEYSTPQMAGGYYLRWELRHGSPSDTDGQGNPAPFTSTDKFTIIGSSERSWNGQTLVIYGEGARYDASTVIYRNQVNRFVFKGFYYYPNAESIPDDENTVALGSASVIYGTTTAKTLDIYPVWFVTPRLQIRTQVDNNVKTVTSQNAYGWSKGAPSTDETLSVSLWSLEDLGYPNGIYGEETLIGLTYALKAYSFSTATNPVYYTESIRNMTYVKNDTEQSFTAVRVFTYVTSKEPTVTLTIPNKSIFGYAPFISKEDTDISKLADQMYYYGVPVIFSDSDIKNRILTWTAGNVDYAVPNQHRYALGSWAVYGHGLQDPVDQGTGSPISFTPSVGIPEYEIRANYDYATYTLNVHVKYTSGVAVYDWVAPFTIKYNVGVLDAGGITRSTIEAKLKAAYPDNTTQIEAALPATSALASLSWDVCEYNKLPSSPLDQSALDSTSDSYSVNGRNVDVYAQFGACPTGISLSSTMGLGSNTINLFATVTVGETNGLAGDGRSRMICDPADGDSWVYSYRGTITNGLGTLVPGQHMIFAQTVAPGTPTSQDPSGSPLRSSEYVSACTVKVNFVMPEVEGAPLINLPQPLYRTNAVYYASASQQNASATKPTVDISHRVASANARGWVFGGWSSSANESVPITEVTFTDSYERTVYPLWDVIGIFRFGQGEFGMKSNNVEYRLSDAPILASETYTVNIPMNATHPEREFDTWVCTDILGTPIAGSLETVDGEQVMQYHLTPGRYVFTAQWKKRKLVVAWARLTPRGGAVALTESDEYVLGTYINSTWAPQYVPSEEVAAPISFNAEGRPHTLRTNFLPEMELQNTVKIAIKYRARQDQQAQVVWTSTLPYAGGDTIAVLHGEDLPQLAFPIEGGAVSFEPGTMFTGTLSVASPVDSVSVTRSVVDDKTVYTISKLTGEQVEEYVAGTPITLEMSYSTESFIIPEIRADELAEVEFVEFAERQNVGNWAKVTNADSVQLCVNLTKQPSSVRVYEIKVNRYNMAYFTEVNTPMIRTSTSENNWLGVDEATATPHGWGSVSIAPRSTPGRYAAVFTAFGEWDDESVEFAYILTFEIVGGYVTGPLCELSKYVRVNGTTAYNHLYLAKPDVMNISITKVNRSYQAKLTTIPILTKSSEYNYCIDLGTKEQITFTVSRTQPRNPDDDSENEWDWTNRKWLEYVKTFFDEWQNLNYDASGRRSGGYGLVYDPHSDATLPVMHKNVFMSSPLEYSYSRAVVNLSFQFTVASMLGRAAANSQNPFKVTYILLSKVTEKTDGGEYKTYIGREDLTHEYFRDTYSVMDLPSGDGLSGAIGWQLFLGTPAIEVLNQTGTWVPMESDRVEATQYRVVNEPNISYWGTFTPGTELPCSPTEHHYGVLFCGQVLAALPIESSFSGKVNIASMLRPYANCTTAT